MWYTTGKITVTNKSATVTATGTQWSVSRHGVLPGMIFIGPDGKLYEIQRVDSDTSLTLSAPYSGPTAKDQTYAIITTYEGDLTQFSAKFSNLLASFGGNRQDLLNWLTAKGDVTITKDDGSKLTVPGLDKINQTKLSRGDFGFGGNGPRITGNDNVGSPAALMRYLRNGGSQVFRVGGGYAGIGSDAPAIYLKSGDVHTVISAGYASGIIDILACNDAQLAKDAVAKNRLFGTANPPTAADCDAADVRNNFAAKMGSNRTLLKDSQPTSAGVWSIENNTWTPEAWGTLFYTNNRPDLKADKGSGQFHHYLFLSHSRRLWVATNVNGGWNGWTLLWGQSGTSVDANGFIKKASPIARLSGAPEKMADDYLDSFTLSGLAAVNDEAAGVKAERQGVGVYTVTGSLGLAKEGWTIEVPQDINGNRLCFVETDTTKDGTITVRVSKRRFDIDTAAIVAGEPMDIPAGRWIDLRLEMPVSEVEEAPEAVEETAALENVNVDPI